METLFRRLQRLRAETPRISRGFSTSFGARNRGDRKKFSVSRRLRSANAIEVGLAPTLMNECEPTGLVSASFCVLSTYSFAQEIDEKSVGRSRRFVSSLDLLRCRPTGPSGSAETTETDTSARQISGAEKWASAEAPSELDVRKARKGGADVHRLLACPCSFQPTRPAVAWAGSRVFGDCSFSGSSAEECSPSNPGVPTRYPPTESL